MSGVEFTFTYSSKLYTGSGTIDATPDPAAGANDYLVVSITGTFDGGAITGLLPTGILGADNLIVFPNTPYLDAGGLSFTTNADAWNIYDPGVYRAFGASDHPQDSGGVFTLEVACFLSGTRILTINGEVPVDHLQPGDMLVTRFGPIRPVKWVGKGKVLSTRGKRTAATPVIVRKSALADNVPNQDLRLTKAHSLYIDGALIPVEFLVNHRTILWDDRAQEVEIYHVELDSHDALLANGAPAESYRDDGNRWLFHNANSGWHLPPQEPCAAVLTGGPVVDAVWRRLLDRAGPRHLPPMTDDPDLHLVVDGQRVDVAEQQGLVGIFRLPGCPKRVAVASRRAVPAELGLARDPRSLGVALRHIAVRRGAKFEVVKASDPRLAEGFHDYEATTNLRWTNGYAALPAELFARFQGAGVEIALTLAGTTRYLDDGNRAGRVAA
jgi:Hint domain